MNFYYHPILGLQYDFLGNFIVVDLCNIPEELNIDVAIENIKDSFYRKGIELYNSQVYGEMSSFNFRG